MFRFALVDAENAESLGVVAFARPDFKPGDVIPPGAGRGSLRVVRVLEPDRDDELPVLVIEQQEPGTPPKGPPPAQQAPKTIARRA